MINYNFKNKNVLVTASSQGIGHAIAKNFHNFGANVIVCSKNKSSLENSIKEFDCKAENKILGIQCDLSDLDNCFELIEKVQDEFNNKIDILINNSGGPPPLAIKETNLNDWEQALNHNLMSSIIISKAVLPIMEKNNFGRIVFLTSTVSKEPAQNMALSNVTRAGVAAFSKTLSKEIPKNTGITVNTILTGGCVTNRLQSLILKQAKVNNETYDDCLKRLSKTVPVGYFASPDEFSKIILYLSSEDASYINGVALPVDGGSLNGVF